MGAAVLVLLHIGHQVGDGLLHHAGRFHHLRQKHSSGAEQVADDIHAVHQRAFDHGKRTRRFVPGLLDVGFDEIGDAVNERVRQPLLDRPFAPGEVGFLLFLAVTAMALGQRQQPLGGIGAAVEYHVLAGLAQLRIEVVIDRHLSGIDDAHIHAGFDGVIEEHRMHRLAHRFVAAERERQVRYAAGNMRVRQVLPGSSAPPR